MAIKWFCTICYHEDQAEALPEYCPKCGAGRASLLVTEDKKVSDDQGDGRPSSLEEVRDLARKGLKGICAVYPHCDGGDDRICQREAYGKPIGFGGAGSGTSFRANVEALAALRFKTRLVGEHFEPDTGVTFAGLHLAMPVMGAPTSGVGRYTEAISELDF
jgi:4-hydroxymandelate oxidase